MSNREPTEIACKVRQIRDKAIAVADGTTQEHTDPTTGEVTERELWVWCPLSQISVEPEDYEVGDAVVVTMPLWLATEKGLV